MKVVLALVLLGLAVTLINAYKTDSGECYSNPRATDYRGFQSKTKYGKQCQNWNYQIPHSHSMSQDNNPNRGIGAHTYCRNPDNMEGGAWCYTTDSYTRWQYCDVGQPSPDSCVALNAYCDNVGTPDSCDMKSKLCNQYPHGADVRNDCPKTCGTCKPKGKREDSLEALLRRLVENKAEEMAEH